MKGIANTKARRYIVFFSWDVELMTDKKGTKNVQTWNEYYFFGKNNATCMLYCIPLHVCFCTFLLLLLSMKADSKQNWQKN